MLKYGVFWTYRCWYLNYCFSSSFRVPSDGHYFFVFSSENEAQENFVRVQFEIDRAIYNVSRSVAHCKNSTEPCSLPLGFFSSETVVLELPVGSNDSLWNQHFVVYSTCEPRTGIFLICLVSVPLVILFFAFQWKISRGKSYGDLNLKRFSLITIIILTTAGLRINVIGL